MARQGLGLAGGVIGAYFGGPVGAQIGFAIGATLGGVLDPPKIQGPRIGEIPVQTGRDGVPIPGGWGIIHLSGNIIQKNAIVEIEEKEKQGKGGGTTVTTIHPTRTFGIGMARSIPDGPIAGILRIWENDKLVYDRRASPAIPAADSDAYEANLTIYLGDEDQDPDPEFEAEKGVGNVPAYRGLPYCVWNNYDLYNFAGAIPQFRFELVTYVDKTITSKPYPIEDRGAIIGAAGPENVRYSIRDIGGTAGSVIPLGGDLSGALKLYEDALPEGIDGSVLPDSGTLDVKLKKYVDAEPEGIDGSVTPAGGDLASKLVPYSNWPPEGIDGSVLPKGGTLT